MKLLSTLAFLVAFALNLFLGTKQNKRTFQKIRSRNTGIVSYTYAMISLILIFVQFWCLTGIIPYYVILLLIVASFAAVLAHNLIGAMAGFGLKQKQTKINILSVVLFAQLKAAGVAVLFGALVMVVVVLAGSLYKFWRLPMGSPEAVCWIAFFLFIIPQIFSILANFITIPILTSEFVDSDVRNYFLSTQFSAVIYSTAALIFPVWIFNQSKGSVFPWMPPGWLILSTPLLIFLICYLVPYFLGASRHRAQVKTQLEWRKEWLRETEELLALPEPNRAGLIEEKNAALQAELRDRTESNELYKFVQEVENVLSSSPPGADLGQPGEVFKIIVENKQSLKDWDIRFREARILEQLSHTVTQAGSGNLSGFIAAAKSNVTDDLATMSKERNLLAGTLWTLASALGPFLFKAYQNQILAVIGHLTGFRTPL
jgi:hypothetical protein